MKNKLVLLLVLALSLVLYGCSNNTEKKNDDGNKSKQESQSDTKPKDESAKDEVFVFAHNGVDIKMNARADEIIKALGKPQSEFVAPTCAFQGNDKVFTYPGFQLNTYQKGDDDYVLGVLILDDSVTTKEGLRLFEDISKIKETYGETEVNEGFYHYEKGDSTLSIVDESGKIGSIEYRAIIKF